MRRRLGSGAALVLALLLFAPASPASAAPVTIDQPAAGAVVETASVVVSGTAEVEPSPLGLTTLDSVTLTVGNRTITVAGCAGQRACTYRETFALPRNGPYSVDVVATPRGLLGSQQAPPPTPRSFAVAAPAARPVLSPPKVTDGRTVDLSWSRNAEPDMLYYAVFRKDPGTSGYFQVGARIPQPTSGSNVTFTDTTTSLAAGGDYAYQVVAVRRGATGKDDALTVASPPSAAGAAIVPVPPTTSTVAPPPGTPAPVAGGPSTTIRPAPPAGVDLSGFLSSRSQPIPVPSITIPEPPDTGFDGSLPFGAVPPGDELEEGEAEAVLPDDLSETGSIISRLDPGRPLVPVAGGLVLFLLALHMRVLGRRVKASPDGDLPPDHPAPAALPPAVPQPAVAVAPLMAEPPVAAEPAPAFYDAAEDDDWQQDPTPPAAAPLPEPEPEVVSLWAAPEPEEEPQPADADPDAIEVVEVVSSARRPLVRAGSR